MSTRGMVATEHPLAAQAGVQVLMSGGNAADAAVATAAVLNVVTPSACGIGGDAFALIHWAGEGGVRALNASGRAPKAATREYFCQNQMTLIPANGMLPVTVPGALDAWATILKRYGSMPLARLLEPAIRHAEDGYAVGELASHGWSQSETRLGAFPDTAKTYLPQGRSPRPGEIFRQPNLAKTLRKIAEAGPDVFYRGELAERICQFSRANGGLLDESDFASHTSTWVDPISVHYRGYDVFECPPNSQGIGTLLALNLLRDEDLVAMGHNTSQYVHFLLECIKASFEDVLAWVSDPDVVPLPIRELLSTRHADEVRSRIPREVASPRIAAMPLGKDTAYLTVVDKDRNAISFITSLYMGFGSGVVAGDTGICLQNRGTLFSLDPNSPNCIAPGKRPFHTIMPAMILLDETPYASFGVTGGYMQPQAQVQVIANLIDFGMSAQKAVDAPRFRYEIAMHQLALEKDIGDSVIQDLTRRGHAVRKLDPSYRFGGAQLITMDPQRKVLFGGTDSRKEGSALGY